MESDKQSPKCDFTPQEAQERFEATLRGALKTPPQPIPSKKTAAKAPARASGASAETGRPVS